MSGVLFVDGIALWAPRLPGWADARTILRGDAPAPDQPTPRPSPSLLPATERRRAPDTVAIALEVAAAACAAAQVDPTQIPSVFSSSEGDLAISDYMCATLAVDPSQISPTRFHNSVHNAAAGYWTIATGALAPYTSLAAHTHTFGAALLEAAMQVAADDGPVLLVAYDIEAKGPMATVCPSRGLFAVALVLSPRAGEHSVAQLRWHTVPGIAGTTPARFGALVHDNAMSPALPLFEALAADVAGSVDLELARDLSLRIALTPTSLTQIRR
jgi:hypothetical protein